jgi:hypothetical protein
MIVRIAGRSKATTLTNVWPSSILSKARVFD